MNLLSKVLLLSCMITGGLHCSDVKKDVWNEGIQVLKEIAEDCNSRYPMYYSKPLPYIKKSKVEDLVICELVQLIIEKLEKAKRREIEIASDRT